MLRSMRHGQRWITALFIVVVGAVFIFYLGVGGSGRRAPGSVVQVGPDSFGRGEFLRVRANRADAFQQQLGDDFDAQAMSDTLDEYAAQTLIQRAILVQEARALGLRVSKGEIERFILAIDGFRDAAGRFDPKGFDDWAQHTFGSQRNFIREQRSNMLITKLLRIINQLARVSEGEVQEAVKRRLEEIQISYVVLDPSARFGRVEPDPTEIEAFLFTRGDDARALYDERSHLYDLPDRVRVRHILLGIPPDASDEQIEATRQRAQEIVERIRAGEDFATLAQELSEDPGSKNQGGDLGFFSRGQMVVEFEQAAFSRELGELGDPVKSRLGYHVLRIEERQDAHKRNFEDVQEELAAEILSREGKRDSDRDTAERLANAIQDGVRLEDAVRNEGLTLERSGRLRRRPDGFVPNLGSAPDLMATAFSMKPGQSSDRVFEVGDKLVLVQLVEKFSPDEEALSSAVETEHQRLANQINQSYTASWIEQRRATLAEKGEISVDLDAVRGVF